MEFGKIENGKFELAPDTIFYRNRYRANPSDYTLRMAGYKEVQYGEIGKYDDETQDIIPIYKETEDTIFINYEIKDTIFINDEINDI